MPRLPSSIGTSKETDRSVPRGRLICATQGDGRLQPLDILAAYYISDQTSESYVFSLSELESVRMAMLYGLPTPDFRGTIIRRIAAIWKELQLLEISGI